MPLEWAVEGSLEIDDTLIFVDCHLAGYHPFPLGQRPYLMSVAVMKRKMAKAGPLTRPEELT